MFERINVKANSIKEVKTSLSKDDFSFWNPKSQSWQIEKGDFEIQVGSSSADIRIFKTISVSN